MSARFRPFARLMAALFCTSFAVVLLGAGVAGPPPPPFSSAGPTVLIVFPFRTADGVDPESGRDYAFAVGKAMNGMQGLKVVLGDASVQQSDFLKVAAAANADYYLSGYISGTVNGTSNVLEQLVSRRSGTAVWGNTVRVSSAADINNQAPAIHDALMTYVGRGYYAILNPVATPPPPKEAPKKKNGITTPGTGSGGGPDVPRRTLDLPNEAYGFSSAPTAPPKVYASAAHPTRFAILPVTSSNYVPDAIKRYTENSLVVTLSHHGQPALPGDPEQTKHYLMHPQDTCKLTGSAYLVFGVIGARATDPTTGVEPWTDATYTPMVYDCTAQAYNRSSKPIRTSAFDWKTAVDRATYKATTDFFAKLGSSPAQHS
jgi:hypothetical protein